MTGHRIRRLAYQDRGIAALDRFLEVAAIKPHHVAYDAACEVGEPGQYRTAYRAFDGLPETPWCCLRLPTGGGKTLLASRAIGVAHRRSLQAMRFPVAIWLVPTTTIAEQTLKALQTPGHAYLEPLREAFGESVRCLSIDDRRSLKPQDLATGATVIVATVQSFRVSNAAGRKVYQDDEELEGFFKDRNLPPTLMRNPADSRSRPGEIAWSFANLMAMVRPIVIVDEAHNFTSELSGQTLARVRPQSIIEFTATPLASNVISSATAGELKAEQMIKLPIHLVQHGDWQTVVVHAMQRRQGLAQLAEQAGEPIRPIALYQAEANRAGAEGTVEAMKAVLLAHGATEDEIRIATGNQRELDGVDLFDPACTVKHVITVEALKEGWDCSFAYVFASVANIRSATSVEQLLGRVLRMPFAQRRPTDALNHAYAFAVGQGFHDAANALRDRLVGMGFDERAARDAIVAERSSAPSMGLPNLQQGPAIPPVRLSAMPNVGLFAQAVREIVTVREGSSGYEIALDENAPDEVLMAAVEALAALPDADDARPAVASFIARRAERRSPAERGNVMVVPALALQQGAQLDLIWPESLLDLGGWTLENVEADLSGFVLHDEPEALVFDIADGQVQFRKDEQQLDLALVAVGPMDEASLARWLDANTRQLDATPTVYLEFCRRVVHHLVAQRGYDLAALIRGKAALKLAIERRVAELRQAAGQRGLQLLMTDIAPALDLGDHAFRFGATAYNPPRVHQGGWQPTKHFYGTVGAFDGEEELLCAKALDEAEAVKHWVRNVPQQHGSFWLPTSRGRFFPDFVAELADGRIALIEYKGAHLVQAEDTLEKVNVGRRYEEVSGGKTKFILAVEAFSPDFRKRLSAALR